MGEVEGSYRAIQTPGTRLGAQFNAGISTLEPGQSLGANMASGAKSHGRGLQIRVMGLDDSQEFYNLEPKAIGQTLLSQVFQRVNLIESDYFGLEFQNMQMNWVWLEPTKPIVRQMRRPANTLIRLAVKFFPPDPGQLQEEYTRYLFSLQMKRDLTEDRLICTENTGALLASHLIQSEIGDYEDIADRDFLRLNEFLPYQEKVQEKIMELHRRHQGQTPAESDFQVLEIARKLEMYGVRYHPAADREGTKIHLAVAHMGLQVFQGNTKINTFNWSKIRKLSFKRKRFLIKLHPEVHGPHQDTLEFMMASRDQCKIFWKNCVEHHSFFRLFDQPQPKAKAILFTRGSSFRYSGRTQKQLVEYVRDSGTKHTPYERRNSKIRMSARSMATDVPKQCLSFNDSLRSPFPSSPATVSFHSSSYLFSGSHPQRTVGLQAPPPLSLSPPTPAPQLARMPPRAARPPSPPKEEEEVEEVEEVVVAALEEEEAAVKGNRYTSQGAPSYQAAGQHCGPLFVCVNSSVSQIAQASLQNGNEDRGVSGTSRWSPGGLGNAGWSSGGLGTAGWSPGGLETAGWSPGGLGTGGWSVGGLRKGMLTPEAFEAELMRVKQNAAPVFLPAGGGPPLQISEEFIDDDPAEMSFYAGGAEAYAPSLGDKAGPCGGGFGGVSGGLYGLGLEDLNGNRNPFSGGRSETSSLANNRSGSSSLDNLGLSSAGECLSGGYGVPLSSSSSPSLLLRRLPGSDFPSEASSMVNFPACSVRSDASSAVQFSDLVEQLELLSFPPTATEGSASGSSDSESDWGSEGSLPPEQSLFYSNPLTGMGGDGGIEGFLLQCQNLRALALADPPTTATGSPHV